MTSSDLSDVQAELIALFSGAPIKKITGMSLSYKGENARFDMPYNPHFDHALNGVHGGLFATLLDNAGWFTVAQHYDSWIATVEMQMRLLEHVKGEDLVASGRLIKRGKRLAVAEMQVRTAAGRLVATGSGSFAPTSVKR